MPYSSVIEKKRKRLSSIAVGPTPTGKEMQSSKPHQKIKRGRVVKKKKQRRIRAVRVTLKGEETGSLNIFPHTQYIF